MWFWFWKRVSDGRATDGNVVGELEEGVVMLLWKSNEGMPLPPPVKSDLKALFIDTTPTLKPVQLPVFYNIVSLLFE